MSRRTKGVEREAVVIGAAADLIAERGLAQLRVSDIAERAGMSVGHVTYYFPSKSELLVRAIQQSEAAFHAEVREALDALEGPWERLCTLVEMAAADGPGDRGWLLWFEVWANAATDEQVACAQRELDGWWRTTMHDIVLDGLDSGVFRCEAPARATAVLSALTDGLSVQLALGGEMERELLVELVLGTARDLLGVRP